MTENEEIISTENKEKLQKLIIEKRENIETRKKTTR